MYRALKGSDLDHQVTQNDDLASLGGVLKYIHTEIIVESQLAQRRWERKYSIDAIMKRRFKVQNSPSLDPSHVMFADFGPFVTYDRGQSTNPDHDRLYKTSGDFVGVQENRDPGFVLSKQSPSFWYSVSGFCPNFPWRNMPMPDGTSTARCTGPKHLCQAKGTPSDPARRCITYANSGDVVSGGLCDGGADLNNAVPAVDPNGTNGCVYTYGKASMVPLDDLAGVSRQKCSGGRACTDWLDFRRNCDDASLKKMFDSMGQIIDAKNVSDHQPYCVEYDIHPACNLDCSSPECQNAEKKEIGIPFWLGRCDPEANQHRVAIMADALGIEGALDRHQTVAQDVLEKDVPCIKPGATSCLPTFDAQGSKGGPYCSRSFAGVCYECYIPGTKTVYRPDADIRPTCPYDILEKAHYRGSVKPNCNSTKPSDTCCLYTSTCTGSDDPSQATLDPDGLRLVEHRCWKESSSDALLKFATRVARETLGGDIDPESEGVQSFVYRQWGMGPGQRSFEAFQAGLSQHVGPAPATPAPAPSPPSSGSGGPPLGLVLILAAVGALAAVAGLVAGVLLLRARRAKARQPLLAAQGAPSA